MFCDEFLPGSVTFAGEVAAGVVVLVAVALHKQAVALGHAPLCRFDCAADSLILCVPFLKCFQTRFLDQSSSLLSRYEWGSPIRNVL